MHPNKFIVFLSFRIKVFSSNLSAILDLLQFDDFFSQINSIRIELIWLKKSSNWSKSKIALRFDEKTLIRKDKKTINLLGCTRLCRLSSLGKITIWKKSGKIPLFPFYFSVLMWTMKIGFPQFPKLLRDSQISRNWRNDLGIFFNDEWISWKMCNFIV